MTLEEETRLRKQDKKLYDLKKNKDFLKKYKDMIKDGYDPILSIDGMQYLLDYIVKWYEIKYPDVELQEYMQRVGEYAVKPIASYMDTKQLLSRLSNRMVSFMRRLYRGCAGGYRSLVDDKGEEIGGYGVIAINVGKDSWKNIYVNTTNGLVEYDKEIYDCFGYRKNDKLYIYELVNLDKSEYNTKELEKVNKLSQEDWDLCNDLMFFTALKMIYSDDTVLNLGIKRAKIFLEEIQRDLNIKFIENRIVDTIDKELPKVKIDGMLVDDSNRELLDTPSLVDPKQLSNNTRKITKVKIKRK